MILTFKQHGDTNQHATVIILPQAPIYYDYKLLTALRSVSPYLGIIKLAVIDTVNFRELTTLSADHYWRRSLSVDPVMVNKLSYLVSDLDRLGYYRKRLKLPTRRTLRKSHDQLHTAPRY